MKSKKIIPLTPHTGGVLDQVIGREEVIEKYWGILQRQGFVLYAERRFGKSAVLTRMNADGRKDFLTIYKGVEGAKNGDEFVSSLFEHIKEKKLIKESILKKAEGWFYSITSNIERIGGIKFRKTDSKWQKQLNYLLKLLIEQHSDKYIIVMLDEFTIMLNKMEEPEAVNVLGYLRDLVQHEFSKKIRFVYCGSIGINLVLDKIKKNGHYMGDPINHMGRQRLLPLSDKEAMFFCKCLNKGCELNLPEEIMKYIYELSDNIPFFIDALFDKIRYKQNIDKSVIDNALDDILIDPGGMNNLKHFYDRIDNFYPNKILTNHVLNYLSQKAEYTSEDNIAEQINNIIATDRILLNDEIERLWRDGYLKRKVTDGKRYFQFNYSIIKKWWAINKAD